MKFWEYAVAMVTFSGIGATVIAGIAWVGALLFG